MKIVIDRHLTGWRDLRESELLKDYDEIRRVGVHPDLPQRIDDKALGSYCKNNDCALMTSDAKAYTHFFERGTEAIQIRKYGHNKEGDQPVYVVQFSAE